LSAILKADFSQSIRRVSEMKRLIELSCKDYGRELEVGREVIGFDKMVRSWNKYSTYQGEIFTPYGDEDLKRIARINPGYNSWKKSC